MWFVTSARGPQPKLFKSCICGQNWHCLEVMVFPYMFIVKTWKNILHSSSLKPQGLNHETLSSRYLPKLIKLWSWVIIDPVPAVMCFCEFGTCIMQNVLKSSSLKPQALELRYLARSIVLWTSIKVVQIISNILLQNRLLQKWL